MASGAQESLGHSGAQESMGDSGAQEGVGQSGAQESVGQSGAQEGVGHSSPLTGPARLKCPICLGAVRQPAFVVFCMHQFCFRCIRHWAWAWDECLMCRQALEQVLHSVRGDDDYEMFVVGLPAPLRRATAMARARCPQRRYDLRRQAGTAPPLAGRSPGTPSSFRAPLGPGSLRPWRVAPAPLPLQ